MILMKEFRLGNFEAVTSEVVAPEVEPAPTDVQLKHAGLKNYGAFVIELTKEVLELACVRGSRDACLPLPRCMGQAKKTVDAVEAGRAIRDQHYEQTREITADEQIALYREKTQELHGHLNDQLEDEST